MVDDGDSFEKIHAKWPQITKDHLVLFKSKEELGSSKAWRKWGKAMRAANLGNHNLGSRGYPGKQPIWDKEDALLRSEGKENPYDRFSDPQARGFIRARYHKEPVIGDLITVKKATDLENYLVRNLPA